MDTSEKTAKARWIMPGAFLAASLLFLVFPGIDLWFSGLFHEPGKGFIYASLPWAQWFYIASPILVKLMVAVLVLLVLLGLWRRFAGLRRRALFLLTAILLGPGLLVLVLKDYWDRARPWQVVEFGGEQRFTPAWVMTDQCDRNCSFVSGHASGAFSVMALAWVFVRHRRMWLVVGALWGAHMGFIRIIQGGHFLSDVVFAGFVVYFTADLLARYVFFRERTPTQSGAP